MIRAFFVALKRPQGAARALMNAVADALSRAFGIADIDMPATPRLCRRLFARLGEGDGPPDIGRCGARFTIAKRPPTRGIGAGDIATW